MRYLFDSMEPVKRLVRLRRLYIFLDFDGTLVPLVSSPELANISSRARAAVVKLSKCRDMKVAIISGRSLLDLKRRLGVRGVTYVGNHGLEIEEPGFSFSSPVQGSFKKKMAKLAISLKKNLKNIDGALVEYKGPTISVHYRMVSPALHAAVKNIFYDTVYDAIVSKKCRVTFGKKVYELRPNIKWDKGEAVAWLMARDRFFKGGELLPIYIGDDVTDEDAFSKIRKNGIGVVVGQNPLSKAGYYVSNVSEVIRFLNMISSER